jgi:uncharacterized protein YkwD
MTNYIKFYMTFQNTYNKDVKQYLYHVKKESHVLLILKSIIFAVCGFLFILNYSFYPILAGKIEQEFIIPYYRSASKDEPAEDISQPITLEEVETEFTLDPTPTKKVTVQQKASISEDALWQALSIYRKTQGKKDLLRSDKLCQYARKRAEELVIRLKTNPEDPLDAHAGFKRDADSEYIFTFSGFTNIGENLAYTPSYTSATQVIEWGWDTSEEHRKLQLSDDITHGCISGIHPIYVAMYAK